MTVSVIIPTYNRSEYLVEAIRSLLSQTLQPDEIIVVNDGSNDEETRNIKSVEASSEKIILLHNAVNRGAAYSRNQGIEKATGELISFLDDDDKLDELYFEKMCGVLQQSPELDGVQCNTRFIDQANETRIKQSFSNSDARIRFMLNCPHIHSFLFRKSVFDRFRFPEHLTYGEDQMLWLQLIREGVQIHKIEWTGGYTRRNGASNGYDYQSKELFHLELLKSNILSGLSRRFQEIRFFLFRLRYLRACYLPGLIAAMRYPVLSFRIIRFQMKVKLL